MVSRNGTANGDQSEKKPGPDDLNKSQEIDEDPEVDETQGGTQNGMSQDVYDPNQGKEQRRGVRKALRSLEEKASLMKDDPTSVSAEVFDNELKVLDNNFRSNVKAPAEATLDSRALRLFSETALKKSRTLKTDLHAFDTDEFIQRFIQINGKNNQLQADGNLSDEDDEGREINWIKAGQRVMRFSRRVPTMDMMYGPLEIQHKKRKASQRTKIEKNEADRRAPEQIKSSDIVQSENEISGLIKKVHEILLSEGGQEGMNLFKFFINPKSFSQSVENLFCLSFLIRDGRAAIDLEDENNQPLEFPLVYASEPAGIADHQRGHKKTQAIIQLEIGDWKDAIEAFNIDDSVIPNREDPAGAYSRKKKS